MILTVTLLAVAQSFFYHPLSGSQLHNDVKKKPGRTITCIGYYSFGTASVLQPTIPMSISTFMLSSDTTPFNLLAATNLTILNVAGIFILFC